MRVMLTVWPDNFSSRGIFILSDVIGSLLPVGNYKESAKRLCNRVFTRPNETKSGNEPFSPHAKAAPVSGTCPALKYVSPLNRFFSSVPMTNAQSVHSSCSIFYASSFVCARNPFQDRVFEHGMLQLLCVCVCNIRRLGRFERPMEAAIPPRTAGIMEMSTWAKKLVRRDQDEVWECKNRAKAIGL